MGSSGLPRILVVEDDETFRETVREVLRDVGYKVRGARSLKKATKRLTRHKFDLVLSDIHLGDETGFDVLQVATQKRPNAKIILMSALADAEIMDRAKELGVTRVLSKPFRVKELLKVIEELLDEEAQADKNSSAEPTAE
jgi:two-component system, NtrC family, response regulator PilR